MAYHRQLPPYGSFWGQKEMAQNLGECVCSGLNYHLTVADGKQVQGHKERNLAFKS